MPFVVAEFKGGHPRGYFVPTVAWEEKLKSKSVDVSIEHFQCRLPDIVSDSVALWSKEDLREKGVEMGLKFNKVQTKAEIVLAITNHLCEADTANVPTMEEAITKACGLSADDIACLTLWCVETAHQDEPNTIFKVNGFIHENGGHELFDFLAWFAPLQTDDNISHLLVGLRENLQTNHAPDVIYLGTEEGKEVGSVQIKLHFQEWHCIVKFGSGARGSDLYARLGDLFGISTDEFKITWGTSQGASEIQRFDTLANYLYDPDIVLYLKPRGLMGGGIHQKVKKSDKLALIKVRCGEVATSATASPLPNDLLARAQSVYGEMMADVSGDYLTKNLGKTTVPQLETLKAKLSSMVLSEKNSKKLVADIVPIYNELVGVKERIDVACQALGEAFHFQLAQSFFDEKKGKYNITLPDVISAIIASKKGASTMAD